jgi:capsular exopolysaccharide synthesis family protein
MALFRKKGSQEPLHPAKPDEARTRPVRREEIAMIADPRGQIAEQFRGLRNSVVALNPDGASRTVVLTSAVRGEGKTVSTINLAVALAELPGNEVLIVDADLHHPAIEEYLELPNRQGLADVLSGSCSLDDGIRATSIESVSVMGAGSLPDNPTRLLGSDRMKVVLNQLKQRFSFVLIDTPEAMTISDASLIGGMADGILLVVRLGSTPRQYVEQTHNTLETLGGNVLGTCLTAASVENTASNYSRR